MPKFNWETIRIVVPHIWCSQTLRQIILSHGKVASLREGSGMRRRSKTWPVRVAWEASLLAVTQHRWILIARQASWRKRLARSSLPRTPCKYRSTIRREGVCLMTLTKIRMLTERSSTFSWLQSIESRQGLRLILNRRRAADMWLSLKWWTHPWLSKKTWLSLR